MDKKILNMGDSYFYPPSHLLQNLSSVIIFDENVKKREIPSGSVWHFKDFDYRSDILKDDVGCGIMMGLTKTKDVPLDDVIEAAEDYKLGGGNHFLNYGSYDSKLDYFLLHTDLNADKKTPDTLNSALERISDARNKRQEIIMGIAHKLKVDIEIFDDWVHNDVNVTDFGIAYLKGVVDTKKNNNVGFLATNPVYGGILYAQLPNKLNGYFKHGLGHVNYWFKQHFETTDTGLQYVKIDKKNNSMVDSFNPVENTYSRYFGAISLPIKRKLNQKLVIRNR